MMIASAFTTAPSESRTEVAAASIGRAFATSLLPPAERRRPLTRRRCAEPSMSDIDTQRQPRRHLDGERQRKVFVTPAVPVAQRIVSPQPHPVGPSRRRMLS